MENYFEQAVLSKIKDKNTTNEERLELLEKMCNEYNKQFSKAEQELQKLWLERKKEYEHLSKLTKKEKEQYYIKQLKEVNEFIAENNLNAILIESNNSEGENNE